MDGDNVINLAAWKQTVHLPDSRYNEIAEAQGGNFEGMLSFLGQTIPARREVFPMTDTTLTKGEFDANIRRFDESMNGLKENVDVRFSSMQETVNERFSSMQANMDLRFNHMDEKMDMKFDGVMKEIRSLREDVVSYRGEVLGIRGEVRGDNLATRVTAYAMIVTAIIGFLGIQIALMRL